MALQGGDREFGHGDQPTVVYDDSTADAVGGEAVVVTGRAATGDHVTVELAASADNADGILADSATQGDPVQMVSHGLVWAQVEDADNAAPPNTVSTSDTNPGVLSTDGTGPEDYRVYEGEATDAESGVTIALIRFEN